MSSDALFHSISVIMFMRFILSLRSPLLHQPGGRRGERLGYIVNCA